ncbi:MAG: DUF417 family protein [Chloroflexi bacterium]|nr:DUF417 family protein [Chloroflexota bacterium]
MPSSFKPTLSWRSFPLSVRPFEVASALVLRYGLVLFLIGGGLTKFTEGEALTIQPWVSHSPFLGWLYAVTSVQGASILIGVIEFILGTLVGIRPTGTRWRTSVTSRTRWQCRVNGSARPHCGGP